MMASDTTISLSSRVRNLLKERGIAQANLAALTRISPSFLSRLLSKQRPWTMPHVEAVAKALDMSVEEFVADTDAAPMINPMGALVPRETYEALEREYAAITTELQTVRAEKEALAMSSATLEAQFRLLGAERDEAIAARLATETDRDAAVLRETVFKRAFDKTKEELHIQQTNAEQASREAERLISENTTLRDALERSNQLVQTNFDAYQQVEAQNEQLRETLRRKGNDGERLFLAGLIGLGLGAASRR